MSADPSANPEVSSRRPSTAAPAESSASRWVIGALSVVVLLAVVVVMFVLPEPGGRDDLGLLPEVNATLNGLAAVFLLLGFVFVRRRRIGEHKACMLVATAVSAAFLVSYLIHHARVGSVPFAGEGTIRVVYFAILIPHVVLAAVMVPMVLTTLYRALTGRFERHRRIARWTWPTWMFVSVSGVAVYVMLYHL